MTRDNTSPQRLDSLLSGLEDEVLTLDDRELLAAEDVGSVGFGVLRSLIESQIPSHLGSRALDPSSGERRSSSSEASPEPVSGSPDPRRLLEMLIASRRSVPSQVRLAFTADREPTDQEVEHLLAELIRSGSVKADDNGC